MSKLQSKTGPIVQKYGGTSVGNVERIKAVAARVARCIASGDRQIAVVVSAQAGETNRLLNLIKQVNPNPPADAYDMALATGEQVSVALFAAALAQQDITAAPLLAYQLGIRTHGLHSRARISSINSELLKSLWAQGKVPVVAGFQGVNDGMEITTLGRGGSDTSAVALAIAVGARYCEINTDVDGVYTADPRIVPAASRLNHLDYEVALEMASLGSKVLHPRCVELGKKYDMPIVVRNSFRDDLHQGTTIMSYTSDQLLEAPIVSAVTLDRHVAKLTLSEVPFNTSSIHTVFAAISEKEVNVDIIVYDRPGPTGLTELGFTVGADDVSAAVETINAASKKDAALKDIKLQSESDLAKVSVVGVGMRSHSGVAAKTFAALARHGIDILMVSTSEIKISCVVSQHQAEQAVAALHEVFFD